MRWLAAPIATWLAIAPASAAPEPQPVEVQQGDLKLKAMLYRPEGNGPFPVVVALAGCAGLINPSGAIGFRYRDWAQRLVGAGFAVLYPDSYGSRGLGNQCGVRPRSARVFGDLVADANAARLWLQNQSWAAADRISLLGWSSGANTALWTVRPRTPGAAETNGADFRSAVVFYPGCSRLLNAAWATRVPTLILIGSADDVTKPSVCQQMVAGARGRSARIVVHLYPGAHHDFDHPNRPLQSRSGYAFSRDGTGRVHSGTNPAARADALKRVPEWFSR